MQFAVVSEIISRALIWNFYFALGVLAGGIFSNLPANHWYYLAGVALVCTQFTATFFFGNDGLVRDLREICIYAGFLELFGLYGHFTGQQPTLYIILSTAVGLLMLGRLMWPAFNATRDQFVVWPIFGILGWFTRRQRAPATLPTIAQSCWAYVFIAFTFVIATANVLYQWKIMRIWYFSFVPVLSVPYFLPKILGFLHDFYQRLLRHELRAEQAQQAIRYSEVLAQKDAEKQQLIVQLQHTNAENQRLLAELQQFNAALRDASHDLAQPQMYVDLIAHRLADAKGEELRATCARDLLFAVAQMGGCIDDTIQSAKIATQIAPPRIEPIAIGQVLRELHYVWREQASEKGIAHFELYPATDPDIWAATDGGLLRRILRNLIVNAILYVPEGGSILIAVRKRHDHCVLQVWDSGVGLPMAYGPDGSANFAEFVAWSRKYRHSRRHGGHGLGVNNVAQLCNVLGVQMHVHARAGRGTRFSLTLPLADSALRAASAQQRSQQIAEEEDAYRARYGDE